MGVQVYEVFEQSRNDPDKGPDRPAAKGMWTWWRTGPHPQGVWQAMEWSGPDGMATQEAYAANKAEHPVFQDQAHGTPGDFGHFACHACDYLSDGYPEPNHKTNCDGICRRSGCRDHPLFEGLPNRPMYVYDDPASGIEIAPVPEEGRAKPIGTLVEIPNRLLVEFYRAKEAYESTCDSIRDLLDAARPDHRDT